MQGPTITNAEIEQLFSKLRGDIRGTTIALPNKLMEIIRDTYGDQISESQLAAIEAKLTELCSDTRLQADRQIDASLQRLGCTASGDESEASS